MARPLLRRGTPMFSKSLQRGLWLLLILNALDFAASKDKILAGQWYERVSGPYATIQLALLAVLGLALVWHLPRIWAALRRLPVPRAAAVICGGALLLQSAHIVLHQESFPFSHVGMFNHVMDGRAEHTVGDVWVVPGESSPVSIYREGDPLFARFDSIDSRLSWAQHSHRAAPQVRKQLVEAAQRHGKAPPQRSKVRFSVRDGRVLALQGLE